MANLWVVAVAAAAATASAQVDCSTQPAWAGTNTWIVGYWAEQYLIANPDKGNYIIGYNISQPIDIKFGCEVNYWLEFGDKVYVRVTKMHQHSMLDVSWVQELQSENTPEVTTPRWYWTWEKHTPFYIANGGPGPGEWDDWNNQATLAGSYSWPVDTTIDRHDEARCDFYHQILDAQFKWYYFHWGILSEANCWEHVGPEHYGEEDGKLITTLWTGYSSQQHSEFGAYTHYKGQMEWSEQVNIGGMKPDQYSAIKQFYQDTCANRRDGTAWNAPWTTEWSWSWHTQNVHRDEDNAPYCSWLKETGWNDAYWESDTIRGKYECHIIDGISCDQEGNVVRVNLIEQGLKGSAKALLDATAHQVTEFRVHFNSLTGTLPPAFATNTKLSTLNVWKNQFNGDVPCLNQSHIDISYNLFEHLPSCLFHADQNILYLEHNSFQGTIDPAIGQLSTTRILWLSYNLFTGTLPSQICNLHNVLQLDLGGNRLGGSIPNACLNAGDTTSGWKTLARFNIHHNRLTGTLPQISAAGRAHASNCVCGRTCGYTANDFNYYSDWFYYFWYTAWYESYYFCDIGLFDFDHNFFGGEYVSQWDPVIGLSASKKGILTLRAEGNRLSGPLPNKLEAWSFYDQDTHYLFTYALQDNLFRCEKDGRWPDWTLRHESSPLLGQCLPIAHPMSVSPTEATIGQAGQLAVAGRDFVSRGQQRCKYTRSGTEFTVAATRVSDDLIRCLVPASLTEGTYAITVSNYAEDWASAQLIDGFSGTNLQVTLVKPVVPSSADALSVSMTLAGVDAETFDSGNFISGIASLLQVSPADVVLGTRRRLQGGSGSGYPVTFIVLTAESQSVDAIVVTLEDGNAVKNSLVAAGMTTVTEVTVDVSYTKAQTAVESKTESELPIIWIAVGGAAVVVACCLCGFIGFIYRMEKKGQSYFKEDLNDDAAPTPNNNGQVIGKSGGEEESNNV